MKIPNQNNLSLSQESKSGPPKYERALVITLKQSKSNGSTGPKIVALEVLVKKIGFRELRTGLSKGYCRQS
jgi:hypothetical protein